MLAAERCSILFRPHSIYATQPVARQPNPVVVFYPTDCKPKFSERCSMGFQSGEFVGCSIRVMPCYWIKVGNVLAPWDVMLSYYLLSLLQICCIGNGGNAYQECPHTVYRSRVHLRLMGVILVQSKMPTRHLSHTPHSLEGVRIMFINRPWAIQVW